MGIPSPYLVLGRSGSRRRRRLVRRAVVSGPGGGGSPQSRQQALRAQGRASTGSPIRPKRADDGLQWSECRYRSEEGEQQACFALPHLARITTPAWHNKVAETYALSIDINCTRVQPRAAPSWAFH